jgi:hypothetical protein
MEHRQYKSNTNNKEERNKNPYFADDQVVITESETYYRNLYTN